MSQLLDKPGILAEAHILGQDVDWLSLADRQVDPRLPPARTAVEQRFCGHQGHGVGATPGGGWTEA